MPDTTILIAKIISNIIDNKARGVILECLYKGTPIQDVEPDSKKRVDILCEFFSAFLRVCYLEAEDCF